ncbi:ATP-binding protein [Wielerella bovis]|uniref:ATP-binding protein n=1 Tax=Wielerella bovis TaxID=2917790 RepID=UPI0020187161|nr:ATP-binding protein [Wielerella bovis]ULJ61667.1 ATP-binding protein [Wielerella bovis]ULJ63793.1 ATP-binding protein [Wielerella bovis]ULJ66039.1 ATP-binding protein [Wielerella bovis]
MNKIKSFKILIKKIISVLNRLDMILPPEAKEPDWQQSIAFRWQAVGHSGVLHSLPRPHTFPLTRLAAIDKQMAQLVRNTEQFLAGKPANNVLLTGARGTGKSSLIKALLHEYAERGLRLIEVDKHDLTTLPALLLILESRPEKFIVFCDDLSFEDGEEGYKALKTALDGSLSCRADNVLVYATSNRRHLMPEYMDDNVGRGGEIHAREAVEEKVSLSDRFGLWLSFYAFDQNEYLVAAENWLRDFGLTWDETARQAALQWAQTRGSRSGRTAYQFACDWAGRNEVERV